MFNKSKNEYRKEIIFKDDNNKIKDVTGIAKFIVYAHVARFFISEKPFTEVVGGQVRERKGWIMCVLADPQNKDVTQYLGVGFAFCSPKDEWDVNTGMVKAFVDAVGDMVYTLKKEVLDSSIPEIMKLPVLPTIKNSIMQNWVLGFYPPSPKNVNQYIPDEGMPTKEEIDKLVNRILDALGKKGLGKPKNSLY